MKNNTVLYVEDNLDISEEISFFLKTQVKELFVAYDGLEGLKQYKKNKPDLIISDIQMPNMNGIDMIKEIRKEDPYLPIIITTAFNESEYLLDTINLQVSSYIIKPLSLKQLVINMQKILEPVKLKKQLEIKNQELEEINKKLDRIVDEKTEELRYLYSHESITGLYNYITLDEVLNKYEYNYLLLLEITNFSLYNKEYGKNFSNEILKSASIKLKEHIDNTQQLFKIESDKFVILINENNPKNIEIFCDKIINDFDDKFLYIKGKQISINFAIGIEKITENKYPIINAEYAISSSKDFGGRFFNFYNEKDENYQKNKYQIGWLTKTKEMIHNKQIEAYYQPIMDIKTGKIIKYEVLARGKYQGDIYLPYYFIGAAEKLGIIDSITRIIIDKSFRYFSLKNIEFSINITQRDLLDDTFTKYIKEKLNEHNIKAQYVTLEVLENVTVGKYQKIIINNLKIIKELGLKIAIDDFGVEYSNFSRLLDIKFDYIKFDSIFIKDICNNKNNRTIIAAMSDMAKSLGIKTIAEYVENEDILNVLKNQGVDMAQGYYIGKPKENIIS